MEPLPLEVQCILNYQNRVTLSAQEFAGAVESSARGCLAPEGAAVASAAVLSEVARHLCVGGEAKRLRPLLVLKVGELLGASGDRLMGVAVAAEHIHGSSLLHDDVVDDGAVRRGRPTANVVFGNAVAVLAGDWLLSRAIQRLRHLPPEITHEAVDCIAEMAAGAVAELGVRGRADVRAEALRAVALGKTGALFAWCGWAAARVPGRAAEIPVLEELGRRLGVAFQMADDLKDLCDDRGCKKRFADIRAGNPSFALAQACEASPDFAASLSDAWARLPLAEDEVEALGRAALDAGGAPAAAALDVELARAAASLAPLGPEAWLASFAPFVAGFTAGLPGGVAS